MNKIMMKWDFLQQPTKILGNSILNMVDKEILLLRNSDFKLRILIV